MDNNNDLINDAMLRTCIYNANSQQIHTTSKAGNISIIVILCVIIILIALATIYCLGYLD